MPQQIQSGYQHGKYDVSSPDAQNKTRFGGILYGLQGFQIRTLTIGVSEGE